MGSTPARPSRYATLSDGCAPTESQYLIRSMLSVRCLLLSICGMGSNVPTISRCLPSRGDSELATYMR